MCSGYTGLPRLNRPLWGLTLPVALLALFYRLPLAPTRLNTLAFFSPTKGTYICREVRTSVTLGFGEIGCGVQQRGTLGGIAVMDLPNAGLGIRFFFLVAVVVGTFALGNVPLSVFAQPSAQGDVLPGLSPVEKQQQVIMKLTLCAVFQSPGIPL